MTLDDRPPVSAAEREALEFLKRGGRLRGLSPVQLRRIEHRLHRTDAPQRRRRRLLRPALGVACLMMVGGTAMALSGVDISRVPVLGTIVETLSRVRSGVRTPRALPSPPRPPAPATTEPPPAAPRPSDTTNGSSPRPAAIAPPRSSVRGPIVEGATRAPRARGPNPRSEALRARDARPLPVNANSNDLRIYRDGTDEAPSPPAEHSAAATPALPAAPAPFVRADDDAPRKILEHAPPATVDAITEESRLFSRAISAWLRGGDARAALTAVDAYELRFPAGQMQIEARLLRAEILLKEGREREGLVLLDRVSLAGLPRGRELAAVRGELRIKFGRCAEGKRDLQSVLARDRADALGRRATQALLLCP